MCQWLVSLIRVLDLSLVNIPPMKLGEGNVFIGVCRSFSRWGWVSLVLCSFRGRYVGVGYVRVWVRPGVEVGMSRVGMSRWVGVCLPLDMRPQGVGMSGSCYVHGGEGVCPEGEYVQGMTSTARTCYFRGGYVQGGLPPPQGYGRQAGGTHPTGMFSNFFCRNYLPTICFSTRWFCTHLHSSCCHCTDHWAIKPERSYWSWSPSLVPLLDLFFIWLVHFMSKSIYSYLIQKWTIEKQMPHQAKNAWPYIAPSAFKQAHHQMARKTKAEWAFVRSKFYIVL